VKRSKPHEVEIQVTPMLDMAFQLLTFFILTYQPAPIEGQFALNLLPASPQASPDLAPAAAADDSEPTTAVEVPASLRTLTTTLYATPAGTLDRATVGDLEAGSLEELEGMLRSILEDESLPFDQALILAEPELAYEEIIKVVNIYMNLDLTKISFGVASGYGGPSL
jgi:biopolymer transport protein ExbD